MVPNSIGNTLVLVTVLDWFSLKQSCLVSKVELFIIFSYLPQTHPLLILSNLKSLEFLWQDLLRLQKNELLLGTGLK